MEHLGKMIDLADAEFASVAKNGKFRSREEIDSVYKLMDIVKDAMCIANMEEEAEYSEYGGDSYRGGSYRGGSYRGGSYRGSYEDGMSNEGNSYARGRGRGAKRYADGRYAPYSRDGGSYRSGNSGYSRGDEKQEYIENLRSMMQDAPDEQTRQNIQKMISQMEMG